MSLASPCRTTASSQARLLDPGEVSLMLNICLLACTVWLCICSVAAEPASCNTDEAIALTQFLENNANQVEEIRVTRGLRTLPKLSNNITLLERNVLEYLSRPVPRSDHAVIFYSLDP